MYLNLIYTHVYLLLVFKSTRNHIPLKYKYPNYCCIKFRHVYLIGKDKYYDTKKSAPSPISKRHLMPQMIMKQNWF